MALDPKNIFATAYQFTEAAKLLGQRHPPIALPVLSMTAFALELQFKALLALEGKHVRNTHDLNSLFAKLSPATQAEIEAEWQDLISSGPKKEALAFLAAQGAQFDGRLTTALSLAAKAFEKFRYAYEGNLPAMYLAGLEQRVCALLLKKRPDFADRIPKVVPAPAPGTAQPA